MTVEAPRLVRCSECGSDFELSARNVRAVRARGEEPRCRRCQHPAKQIDAAEAERLRQWWLARFTLEELREMAAGLTDTLERQ